MIPTALKVEAAYNKGRLIGLRLSVGDAILLVFDDQQAMPGVRVGDAFIGKARDQIVYRRLALTNPLEACPEVDAVIDQVMSKYQGVSPAAQLRYFEAVHQELAPLARRLERDNAALRVALEASKS